MGLHSTHDQCNVKVIETCKNDESENHAQCNQ